eukprot:2684822-Pleurochrysis_carterae.AAC.2
MEVDAVTTVNASSSAPAIVVGAAFASAVISLHNEAEGDSERVATFCQAKFREEAAVFFLLAMDALHGRLVAWSDGWTQRVLQPANSLLARPNRNQRESCFFHEQCYAHGTRRLRGRLADLA